MLAQMGQTKATSNAASQAGNIASTNLQAGLHGGGKERPHPGGGSRRTSHNSRPPRCKPPATAQQQQQLAVDNANQGQFYQQQEWPYQNLDTLLSAVGAVPYGTSVNTTGTGYIDAIAYGPGTDERYFGRPRPGLQGS